MAESDLRNRVLEQNITVACLNLTLDLVFAIVVNGKKSLTLLKSAIKLSEPNIEANFAQTVSVANYMPNACKIMVNRPSFREGRLFKTLYTVDKRNHSPWCRYYFF